MKQKVNVTQRDIDTYYNRDSSVGYDSVSMCAVALAFKRTALAKREGFRSVGFTYANTDKRSYELPDFVADNICAMTIRSRGIKPTPFSFYIEVA
jgi:hypothetical protein